MRLPKVRESHDANLRARLEVVDRAYRNARAKFERDPQQSAYWPRSEERRQKMISQIEQHAALIRVAGTYRDHYQIGGMLYWVFRNDPIVQDHERLWFIWCAGYGKTTEELLAAIRIVPRKRVVVITAPAKGLPLRDGVSIGGEEESGG